MNLQQFQQQALQQQAFHQALQLQQQQHQIGMSSVRPQTNFVTPVIPQTNQAFSQIPNPTNPVFSQISNPTQMIPQPQQLSKSPTQQTSVQQPQYSGTSTFQPQMPPQPPIAQPQPHQNPYMGKETRKVAQADTGWKDSSPGVHIVSKCVSIITTLSCSNTNLRDKLRMMVQQIDPLCNVADEAMDVCYSSFQLL